MILDTSIDRYEYTTTRSAEGLVVKAWVKTGCVRANVQPSSLTEAQLIERGIDTNGAEAKLIFTERWFWPKLKDKIAHDGEEYTIAARNKWPRHCEFIAVPVQGKV